MSAKLPHELRDIIYKDLTTDNNNATFYCGENAAASYSNGQSTLYHCFDPFYTGPGIHKDMVQELCRRGARFDFRGRHEMLSKAMEQYNAELGLDFADLVKDVGITISEDHLKVRDKMLERLEALSKFSKGTIFHVFVEAGLTTQCQVVHSFRRILRAIFNLLERLKAAGCVLRVIMNPARNASAVKDSSKGLFTIVPAQRFRYLFTPDNATFSVVGFELKLKEVCVKTHPSLDIANRRSTLCNTATPGRKDVDSTDRRECGRPLVVLQNMRLDGDCGDSKLDSYKISAIDPSRFCCCDVISPSEALCHIRRTSL